jgi:hypothetical protein
MKLEKKLVSDKTQTYNLVNEIIYHGYIRKKDGSKIYLSDKVRKNERRISN